MRETAPLLQSSREEVNPNERDGSYMQNSKLSGRASNSQQPMPMTQRSKLMKKIKKNEQGIKVSNPMSVNGDLTFSV